MKLRSGLLLITVIAALFAALAAAMPARAAGTCYVNDDASGANNGTDWANAYTNLQSAIADSCTEIWVAAGIYKPDASLRAVSFALETGTAIYGGFAGTETMLSQRNWETNVTILSGDLAGDDSGFNNNGENSYHVVTATNVDSTAVLDGFTISGGNADDNFNPPNDTGGGMFNTNSSSPTLANLIFSGNSANWGGGLALSINGNPTLTDVSITGNSVTSYGGGLYLSSASATLTNVTISNNTATGGGGIYMSQSSPSLTNVTLSGNDAGVSGAGGGIYLNNTSNPLLTNVTFSDNNAASTPMALGGGLFASNSSSPTLKNVLIANSPSGGDCVLNFTSLNGASTNNLIEDGSCSAAVGGDPNLGPLADNGGPTQTFALLPGSPAINAGDDATCNAAAVSGLDQRGIARPNGDHCDIGAYEHEDTGGPSVTAFNVPSSATSLDVPITNITASDDGVVTGYLITESATPPSAGTAGWTASAPTSFTVAATGNRTLYSWAKDDAGNVSAAVGSPASVFVCFNSITVANTNDTGLGSLRQAIADACAGTTIKFNAALSGNTIHLASTLNLTKDVTIDGSSLASQIILSGDSDNNGTGDVRVFDVANDPLLNATLDSLTITKGQTAGDGGAILNWAYLTIANSTFLNNSATGFGGAIDNNRPLIITNSTFSGNSSMGVGGGGGAILNSSSLTISGSTFSGNTGNVSDSNGGALYNTGYPATITNSTFSGNSAAAGGAILTTADLTIANSTISGSTATYSNFVSGLDIEGGTTNLSNTIIANSLFGLDCLNNAAIGTNTNNLIEDGTCSPSLSGDPNLGSLANNGGPTQTFALLAGSKAIDAGDDATCSAAPINNLDQRGITRPNGAHCDIGAYEYVDTTAPTVTAFAVTSPINSLNIPITSFTATDDGILTGYLITTSSTPPSTSASGWTASAPTTYTVVSDGSYTLHPWVKDAVGHVSPVYGSPASVTVDTVAPTAGSLVANNMTTSGGTTYTFTITFSDNVAIDRISLDANDIRVSGPGGFSQLATLVGVAPAGSGSPRTATYQITAPGGAWDSGDNGTYTLALEANQVIDTAGNPISATSLGSFLVSLNYTIYLPLVQR